MNGYIVSIENNTRVHAIAKQTVVMKRGAPNIELDSSSTTADSLFGCSIMNQTEKMERICTDSI